MSRYRAKISGPLLDRIDLQIFVPRVERAALTAATPPPAESSGVVRTRVIACRERQLRRAGKPNAALTVKEVERDCRLDPSGRTLLETALARLGLSARAYHRVLRVARTIADLTDAPEVGTAQLAEALRYRELERGV